MTQNPYGGYDQQAGHDQQPGAQWNQPPQPRGGGGAVRVVVGLLVVAGLVAAGGFFYLKSRNAEIYYVNALNIPVDITFGGESFTVAPHSYLERSYEPGPYDITVSNSEGEVIAEESLEIPGFTDAVAYNVLGAADLYAEGVVYRTVETGLEENPYEIYIGETFVTRDGVDYVFEEAPDEISVSSSSSQETRWYFGFVDPGDWGWQASLDVLVNLGRTADAQAMATNIDQWDSTANAQAYVSNIMGLGGVTPELNAPGNK